MRPFYSTRFGRTYQGLAQDVLQNGVGKALEGAVQLILTSPPFPLNRKKRYGNMQGDEYVDWLAEFATLFRRYLRPNGSIVMEMGNAWEPGQPIMSTLALRALLEFLERGSFYLCQQFICYNPARLPGPAEWVTVQRIRVKDAYTHVWWMSLTQRPKASNRRVLKEYSPAMLKLLSSQRYNAGKRPSEHNISSKSFLNKNRGAIPSNVLTIANTSSSDPYQKYCRANGLPFHPARMPVQLAEFFVKFLTTRDDIVLDPFAGSNTTGAAAEYLGRRWISIEPDEGYLQGSRGRFGSHRKDAGVK